MRVRRPSRRRTALTLPRPLLMLLEPRVVLEIGMTLALLPTLLRAPRGDGHPVLLMPGFGTSDSSLEGLRAFLKSRGYHVETWGLGRNRGFDRRSSALVEQKVRFLHHRHGRRVSLVGWSLGGVFAFYAAHVAPDCVRAAISLGSPLHAGPDQRAPAGLRAMYAALAGPTGAATHQARLHSKAMRVPPPAPSSCLFSESDGLVSPEQATLDGDPASHENIRVSGSHMGLPANAQVMWIVADRLMQPEGAWQPFAVTDLPRLLRRGVDACGAAAVCDAAQ